MTNERREIHLNNLYKTTAVAQISRARGGHYKCAYERAYLLLRFLLGEIPEPSNKEHTENMKREVARLKGLFRPGKSRQHSL
jgi:hypothetical protein